MQCKLCGCSAKNICSRLGTLDKRVFYFYECIQCGFVFVGNPRNDYQNLYNQGYYNGNGADPLVDYTFEVEFLKNTIRNYEWDGIY